MKTKWKHLTFEQRKTISSSIAKSFKLVDIADLVGMNPTSISKEVKRNRIAYKNLSFNECPKLNRWPFVCAGCVKRHHLCTFKKYKYCAKTAQKKADTNLVCSRKGIDLTADEHSKINKAISEGFDEGKSLYQIKVENNLSQSVPTLYSYINKGILDKNRYDLPYACKYKKRKHSSDYDYSLSNKKIDRTSHRYIDYIAYMKKHPWSNVWQMDFLGSKKTDTKSLLTMIMPDLQFPLVELIEKPNAAKTVEFFDKLEIALGSEKFSEIFQVILTDRDPCFSDIENIETSKITGEKRLSIFYCDPYVSTQKPNIENINRQLRRFFPKGKSTNSYSHEYVVDSNITIANTPKQSLDGATPKDAFTKLFGETVFNILLF